MMISNNVYTTMVLQQYAVSGFFHFDKSQGIWCRRDCIVARHDW